jgi:hypothetical protein
MPQGIYKPLRYRKRWFCYLDLLGFTALVNDTNIERVIPLYHETLRHLAGFARSKKRNGLLYSWFSDTFIIYSRDDDEADFWYVEQVGRLFFQKLILSEIPVRGAITHGRLYSQSSQNIFVGPALIDAYHYAEKQSWLGFILTPNVSKRLESTSSPTDSRAHYRLVTEPGIILHEPSSPVYAFAFNNGLVNGKNPYLTALSKMKVKAPLDAQEKYDRTIAFATKHTKARTATADSA